jgi:PAS domain S-box-containing protein
MVSNFSTASKNTTAWHIPQGVLQTHSSRWRIRISPYGLAALSALFGFFLRLAIDPWLGNQMPYITFLVAVALVGLFADVGPALLSTTLGAVIAYWCFVSPRYQWGFQGVSDAAGFFSYLAAALGIVVLTHARRKAYIESERHLQSQLLAEGKLRDAQKMFQLFSDNRPGSSYLRDRSGRYVYVNHAARHLLGLENPGVKLPEVVAELEKQDEQAFKSDTPRQFINRINLPEGERYWMTTKFTFINEQQQAFVGSVSTDVTEQVKAEEIAVEKERLMAATQMMAMMSHEINNPLAAVTNSVYLLCQETLPSRARALADVAQVELSRMAHITRLVLGFYKENEDAISLDLCQLVADLIETLSHEYSQAKPHISNDFAWQGTLEVASRQIQEALGNIFRNSFESGATQLHVRVHPSRDWRNANRSGCRISILDNGRGMTPEQRKRAFEPFFSTKSHRGCGLGLWVSNAIVIKNGGRINLHSTDDASRHGTCISVFLPTRISPAVFPLLGWGKT